ncbi:MAG TPA: type II toxin-antitoxin system VapC family toxin [Dongiaceae bacterium]|nr:type II toxin-antitoxin system VapC family toxin [Dongiaceae bacterium]
MIILDSNVLSAFMRDVPDAKVISWMDRQIASSIWTTAITIFEIESGLQNLAPGKKRTMLSEQFEKLLQQMEHRIAVFDDNAARLAANLNAKRRRAGQIGEMRDTMIAGIVLSRGASLATRNVSHFSDIGARVINPWVA